MHSDFSPEVQAELLNEFYLEADEQLANVRQQLARLERSLGSGARDPVAVESIFRSMHSFKGSCAMAGLPSGERLAHAAEDYLRPQSRNQLGLTAAGIHLLMATTQRLEQLVTAHRLKQPPVEVDDLLRALAAITPPRTPTAAPPEPPPGASVPATPGRTAEADSAAAVRAGSKWRCTFEPSPERDGRGVNINSVRARLSALGEIVSATPIVRSGSSIHFEFIVVLLQPPANLSEWNTDGLGLQPLDEPPTATDTAAGRSAGLLPGLAVAPSHFVRVELSRLDDLMRIAGEMVVHRSRLEDRINRTPGDHSALKEVSLTLSRSLRQLRSAITRARLVPVAEIFTRMPFVVRDLAGGSGRSVRVVLEGEDTEIDKYLVERLKEPLLHLVRNAVTHGVEAPSERAAAGKPAEATLLLRAVPAGNFVHIVVRDDGRGIDRAAIFQRAEAAGFTLPDTLDDAGVLRVLCAPGFSTREEADRAAGRGVGMAVVEAAVRELGGSLNFETIPGGGTQFTLRVPLTLSITETIIVSAGGQTCAVPQGFIDEIIQISEHDVRRIRQAEVVSYRDGVLPLTRLRTMFGSDGAARAESPVLVLTSERGSTGLVVDRVHAQHEIVVRPMQDPLLQVRGVFGATELGDGRPVLILDPVAITNDVVRPPSAAPAESSETLASQPR